MEQCKALGGGIAGALVVLALAIAPAAMAENTQLCQSDESPCAAENVITAVHEVGVGEAELLSSAGTVECLVLFEGTSLGLGAPLIIHGHFKYGTDVTSTHGCHLGGASCTVKELSSSALIEVLNEGHETAAVTGAGEIEVNCGKILICVYNGTGLKGTAKGPLLSSASNLNGEISLQEQAVNRVKGIFCPATAKLDITTTPLSETYLTDGQESAGLHYCVETEHQHGFFTNEACTTVGNPQGRSYRYELWIGPAGLAVGQIVCTRQVTLPHNGLWKKRNIATGACEEDDTSNPTTQIFEKAEIKVVK